MKNNNGRGKSEVDAVRERGYVEADDGVVFRRAYEVLNALRLKTRAGNDYAGYQQGVRSLDDKGLTDAWIFFAHLDNQPRGWENELSKDGNTIEETRMAGDTKENQKNRKVAERVWVECARKIGKGYSVKRVTFGHSNKRNGEAGYRFLGVYELQSVEPKTSGSVPEKLTWKRVARRFECFK